MRVWLLTCPRVCAVDLWLCGVSEDNGSYTVEAVFVAVILQSRLLWAHQVVLAVTSARNQLRNTKLLLQHWESRAITYRGRNSGEYKHAHLFLNLFLLTFRCHLRSIHHLHRQRGSVSALRTAGWSSAESRLSLWCGKYRWCPWAVLGQRSHRYTRRWR